MSKRKTVSTIVAEISPYNINGPLENVQKYINELIAEHGKDARFYWDPNFYYDYDSNPSPRYTLQVQREENDDEYNTRMLQEKKYRDEQERKDLEEFERLSKLFSNR